jgi:hypothetical protein
MRASPPPEAGFAESPKMQKAALKPLPSGALLRQ